MRASSVRSRCRSDSGGEGCLFTAAFLLYTVDASSRSLLVGRAGDLDGSLELLLPEGKRLLRLLESSLQTRVSLTQGVVADSKIVMILLELVVGGIPRLQLREDVFGGLGIDQSTVLLALFSVGRVEVAL